MNTEQNIIEKHMEALIDLVSAYRVDEALHRFYHTDFRAIENTDEPRVGISKTLERMQNERTEMSKLYYLQPKVWMVKDDQSIVQWACEFQDTDGKYWYAEEVNIARWEGEKIIEEQYVYNLPKQIAAPSQTDFIYTNQTEESNTKTNQAKAAR